MANWFEFSVPDLRVRVYEARFPMGEFSPLRPNDIDSKNSPQTPLPPPPLWGSIPIFRMSSKSLLKHNNFGPKSSKFSPAAC